MKKLTIVLLLALSSNFSEAGQDNTSSGYIQTKPGGFNICTDPKGSFARHLVAKVTLRSENSRPQVFRNLIPDQSGCIRYTLPLNFGGTVELNYNFPDGGGRTIVYRVNQKNRILVEAGFGADPTQLESHPATSYRAKHTSPRVLNSSK